MWKSSLTAGLSIALLAGCAAPPSAQHSDELASGGDKWEETFAAGDLDALMGLYSEDAYFLPPNAEMAKGSDEIRAQMQALMDTGLSIDLETVEALEAGDLGYRVGTFTLSTPDGTVADKGKYIEIWRQVGGEWKISRDIYNSDMPTAPTGTYAIGVHEVGDPAVWLAAWLESDTRREQFANNGVASVRVFQSPESETTTGLLLDVVDMEAFQAFLGSEEGTAAAAEDTVRMETLAFVSEVQ